MKVSVITVVLNNRAYLEDCLQSIFCQTHSPLESIVVDGGSTDGTQDIIRRLEKRISRWISEKDRGIYEAMNKGIKMATGEVIGFLNGDDMYFDDRVIAGIVEAFKPDIDCVFGNLVFVSRSDIGRVTRRWISGSFRPGLFEKSWTPAHPTFYCRKTAYDRHGLYRPDFRIAADVELMYRFLQKHALRSRFVDRYFVKMRDSGVSNRGLKSTWIITREMKRAIQDNGGRFQWSRYLFFKLLKIRQILEKNKA
jgi:glycosyltransferase involved in cell wall biosynthesis